MAMRSRPGGGVLGAICGAFIGALIAAAAAQEIHSKHCLFGCPYGGDFTNDLIVREIYTLRSNDLTRFADWVAYAVSRDGIGAATPRNTLSVDPVLRENETLEPDDYRGAGMQIHAVASRQAPAESFAGTPYAAETDFMSNIVPRNRTLAEGPWRRLEDAERRLARRPGVERVYVLTGPVYQKAMVGLPNADEPHVVPSAYWKIIAIRAGTGARVAAFAFEQFTGRNEDHCRHQTSIPAIEQRTALTFFHNLGGPLQPLASELGCK